MIIVVIGVLLVAASFAAGFMCAAVFAAGEKEERHMEFLHWCEQRCGKREECEYEWRDGDE